MRKALPRLEGVPLHHAGLLLDRYFIKTKEEGQNDLLRIAGARPSQDYVDSFDQWRAALAALHAFSFEATLTSRLTIGLGNPSPAENGISLSRTYGVPLIPGSSVKGALRAAAQEALGLPDFEPSESRSAVIDACGEFAGPLLDTFGSPDAGAAITCLDARYVPGNRASMLCLETWTPHLQSYMTGGELRPLETEEPIPISLLAAPRGAKFRFAFVLPTGEWEAPILGLLKSALARGLGAKQNQGYGRFKIDESTIQGADAHVGRDRVSVGPAKRVIADPVEELALPTVLPNGKQWVRAFVLDVSRNGATLSLGQHGNVTVSERPKWLEAGTIIEASLQIQMRKPPRQTLGRNLRPIES